MTGWDGPVPPSSLICLPGGHKNVPHTSRGGHQSKMINGGWPCDKHGPGGLAEACRAASPMSLWACRMCPKWCGTAPEQDCSTAKVLGD